MQEWCKIRNARGVFRLSYQRKGPIFRRFCCNSPLPGVAPGALMQEIADFSLLWSRLLLVDCKFTKDKEFLKRYYPIAKAVLERFAKYEREDGLLEQVADKWNLVDWPENLRDNYDFTLSRPVVEKGCHNVINALYLGALKTLNEIEALLNLPKTGRYSEKLEAFYRAFLDKETGLFVDSEGSSHSAIHSNIYPLSSVRGFVPSNSIYKKRGEVAEKR